MNASQLDRQEDSVPALAVEALTLAHRRAIAAGRTVVRVEGGKLVRVGPSGTVVLQTLPPRVKVTIRTKRAGT